MNNHIIGIRPIEEYLSGGGKPERILIQQGLQGGNFQKLFARIRNDKIPYQMVPVERLNKVSKQNHQGVIAYVPVIAYHSLEQLLPRIIDSGETPLLFILDGITDVRNMGAIARTAECAGAHALVLSTKGSAPVNAEAIKTSAGALSRIPVCRESNLIQTISFLQACGIKVLATDDKAETSIYDCNLTASQAVIMGSEEKGVSSAVRKTADQAIFIPMKGKIASLNVSVATGVIAFETLRQRTKQLNHD